MAYMEKQLRRHRAAMAAGEPIDVVLASHEGQRSAGFVRILRLTAEARGARARTWLFTFLGLAPLSVVCPPHFLWPLVMTTIGVAGYFMRRGRTEVVLGGEAHCPDCQAFQILDPGNAEFPMAHYCSECRRRSLVSLASGDQAATNG